MTTLLIVALVIVLAVVIVYFTAKNGISRAQNQVEEAYSTMDVYLKERHDLIPNLVKIAQGYAKHETEALQQITNTSNLAAKATTLDQSISEEEKMNNATNRFMTIVQSYPDLKANQNFVNLMNQLQKVEQDISNARKYYNACVKEYNNKITTFPGNLVAGGLSKKPYFQVSSESERQNIDINI